MQYINPALYLCYLSSVPLRFSSLRLFLELALGVGEITHDLVCWRYRFREFDYTPSLFLHFLQVGVIFVCRYRGIR